MHCVKAVYLNYKYQMMKKILFLLLATTTSSFLLAQNEAKKIDSLVAKYANDAEFTGTILVSKGGKLLLKKGYGYSNAEKKIMNDASTIYNIASLTKTFTAALILKLHEEGRLSVDDRLSKYYPAFPNNDKITIHHLLTHTSGLFNYTDDKNFWTIDQTKEVKLEDMIALFKDKPLQFEPGTNFRYSNSGYTMLGHIIEKVTGMSYASALHRFIFKPLGMQHSSFGPQDTTSNSLAQGYNMYYKNFKLPAFKVHPSISYATGAI